MKVRMPITQLNSYLSIFTGDNINGSCKNNFVARHELAQNVETNWHKYTQSVLPFESIALEYVPFSTLPTATLAELIHSAHYAACSFQHLGH